MRRRQLLKGIGASGAATVGIGTAAASRQASNLRATDDDLEVLRVVRDGEVVETFDDPSAEDIGRIQSEMDTDDELVNQDDCCIVDCRSDCCLYRCCLFAGDC